MATYSKTISLRWSDLDPNFHLRHSVFYDLGSQFRIELLHESGLTMSFMKQNAFGPVLFREECIFKKEILIGDEITLTAKILRMRNDASRWSIMHEFFKGETLCAQLIVDGAWMDVIKRKLADPVHPTVIETFNRFPKAPEFEWIGV